MKIEHTYNDKVMHPCFCLLHDVKFLMVMFGSQKHLCFQNGSIHFFLVANKKLLLLKFIMLVDDLESSKFHILHTPY